jgi:CheY-like chemotaxis protein
MPAYRVFTENWTVLALKADAKLASIPVIMLIVDDRNLGYALGAADDLTKPIDRDRLLAVLARHRPWRGVREELPGLVRLDLMMPEMDGFEFLAEPRRQTGGRGIPVVVVTAKELAPADHERLDGQVQRILQKGAYTREDRLAELGELVAGVAARPRAT